MSSSRTHVPYGYVDSGRRQSIAAALRAGGEDDPYKRLLSALGVSGLGDLALLELADMLDSSAAEVQDAYDRGYADGYKDAEEDSGRPDDALDAFAASIAQGYGGDQ